VSTGYQDIIKFWFEEIKSSQWWIKDADFDQLLIDKFSGIHKRAKNCELYEWRENAEGRLAEIIILDQFSRNMFRGSQLAFANDPLALSLSQQALSVGADMLLEPNRRSFIYLPFMHSESKVIHERALDIYKEKGTQGNLDFEIRHKNIIDRFGRYPHRNEVLGRDSTAEELKFIKQPGSGF